MDTLFKQLRCFIHKRNLLRSFARPIITGRGRDAVRYYENGRSVTVKAELMSGHNVDRLIYRHYPLKWDDTGEMLSSEDSRRVFRKICQHFDRKNVRWQFSDANSGN